MWPVLRGSWYFYNPGDLACDREGYVYLADTGNHRIRKFSMDGAFITEWGEKGKETGDFNIPSGIAADREGLLYVTDKLNHRVQVFDANGVFIRCWGEYGNAPGQFDRPAGIAVDSLGYIYVSETENYRIQKFTSRGRLVSILADDTGDNRFAPIGLAASPNGLLFACDNANNRIVVFDDKKEIVQRWGKEGDEEGAFKDPAHIVVDSDGYLYVTDLFHDRVQKFTQQGEFVLSFGKTGAGDGEFNKPAGMAAANGKGIYVVDKENHRIQKFTGEGRFLSLWGPSTDLFAFNLPQSVFWDETEEYLYVSDESENRVQKFTPHGELVQEWGDKNSDYRGFDAPEKVFVDSSGFLYVADSGNSRIVVFDDKGDYLREFGSYGDGPGQMRLPYAVSVDKAGNVYVADMGNSRILRFFENGSFDTHFGQKGTGPLEFRHPRDITIGPEGNIHVADSVNNRIQVFTPEGEICLIIEGDETGFNLPYGLDVTANGDIWVADSGNNRIAVFTSMGEPVCTFGEPGSGPGNLRYPGDVAVSEKPGASSSSAIPGYVDRVFTADTDNHRIQIFSVSSPGMVQKAVIVAGGGAYPGNHLWEATSRSTNRACEVLTIQGLNKNSIFYLTPEKELDLDGNGLFDDTDGEPTLAALESAIREWAKDADRLILYLADHGGGGKFRMNPEEILTSSRLSALVSDVDAECIIILDFCDSGAFFSSFLPFDSKKRILISSTAEKENAMFINQGAVSFSTFFWEGIFQGETVGKAFDQAVSVLSQTFSGQTPRLTAWGGLEPAGIRIGYGDSHKSDAPVINSVTIEEPEEGDSFFRVYADIFSLHEITRAWGIVHPPHTVQEQTDSSLVKMPAAELYPDAQGRFAGQFEGFTRDGEYTIFFYAQNRQGGFARPFQANVSAGNPPSGKAVICIGGKTDAFARPAVEKAGIAAYNALRLQGFSADDIRVLADADSCEGFDGLLNRENLRYSIEKWPGTDTKELLVLLVGSGEKIDGYPGFILSDDSPLYAGELREMADYYQNPEETRMTIILDFDFAGDFIPALADSPPGKRILVASAPKDEKALFIPDGPVSFSGFFFDQVAAGMDTGSAFFSSQNAVKPFLENSSSPYLPVLDANGNGIANEREDMALAGTHMIGNGIRFAESLPVVGNTPETIIPEGQTKADIRVRGISHIKDIQKVWAVVTLQGSGIDTGSASISVELDHKGDGLYEGKAEGLFWFGIYQVAVFATDGNTVSRVKETEIFRQTGPDRPEPDNELSLAVEIVINDPVPLLRNFHEEGDTDFLRFYGVAENAYAISIPEAGSLAQVEIVVKDSKENPLDNAVATLPGKGLELTFIPENDGFYYVQIKNTDPLVYGTDTWYRVNVFQQDAGFTGFIKGSVLDEETSAPLVLARLETNAGAAGVSRPDGRFILVQEAGVFDISVHAEGYFPVHLENVEVNEAATTIRDIRMHALLSADTDGDGVHDENDGCPDDPEKDSPGYCGCGIPETDRDGDAVPDCKDLCPDDPDKQQPGICGCKKTDSDTDSDGTPDCNDECPEDPGKTSPGECGCGQADLDENSNGITDCTEEENDKDGDGTPDHLDGCPDDPVQTSPGDCGCGQADLDENSNGITDCTEEENDKDGDGTPDHLDECPDDPVKTSPGKCGCGQADLDENSNGITDCTEEENDKDGDGTPDHLDGCPDDPVKTAAGVCGCGHPDLDENSNGITDCTEEENDKDGDGTPDHLDECPDDPVKTAAGVCGCKIADTDTDLDGTPDCNDGCPDDPEKTAAGVCGCGAEDADQDGDGIMDCKDDNLAPHPPVLLAPGEGEIVSGTNNLFLETSAFSDPDPDDTHEKTRFQIALDPGFSHLVMDQSAESPYLTQYPLVPLLLAPGETCYARAWYMDSRKGISGWSETRSFSIRDNPEEDINADGVRDDYAVLERTDINGNGKPDDTEDGLITTRTASGNFTAGLSCSGETGNLTGVYALKDEEFPWDREGLVSETGILVFRVHQAKAAGPEIHLYLSRKPVDDLKLQVYSLQTGWHPVPVLSSYAQDNHYAMVFQPDPAHDLDGVENETLILAMGILSGQSGQTIRPLPVPEDDISATGCFMGTLH